MQRCKAAVSTVKAGLTAARRRRYVPMRSTPEHLNAQYSAGKWDCLYALNQHAHYSVITGYCRLLRPAGSILDVGCGEGVLRESLAPLGCSFYLGIDLSDEAINRAQSSADDRTRFLAADARTFTPDRSFDLVIFNECLYYFKEPIDVARRYEAFLADGGRFIVSMYDAQPSRAVWAMLDAECATEDATVVSQNGVTWTVKVLKPNA